MSFTQPLALLGLLFIPLLVSFYMWRARHRRQYVSSTWLWSEAVANFSHTPHSRLPLREPLLVLQLLGVLLLTFLFAGPRLAEPAHVHQIVVVDGSVAMAATDVAPTRFAVARQRVEAMIKGMGSSDSMSVILAGPHARLVGEIPGNVDLAAAVEHLNASQGPADLAGASAIARGLVAEKGSPHITYVAAQETPAFAAGRIPETTERIGSASLGDQTIDDLSVRCQAAGGGCQAFARIRSSAGSTQQDDLAVWADGQSLGRQALSIPAHGSLDLVFSVPAGAHVLKASLLRQDSVAADNTAWALVPAPLPRKVLLVADDPGQLLTALRAVPGVSVQLMPTAKFQYAGYNQYDLIVLDAFPPDNFPPVPLLIVNPPVTTTSLVVKSGSAFLAASTIDTTDPLVQGLDMFGLAVTGETIVTPSWAHVIIGSANGPILAAGSLSGARTAVLPFDVGHSLLAQNLAFPLLMARLVDWLVPQMPAEVTSGDSVSLPSDVAAVVDPSGTVDAGQSVDAALPGVYTVASGTGARTPGQALFVANASSPGDAITTADVGLWQRPSNPGRLQIDAWPIVLVLVLAALGAEWWFYARRT
jgi:hypothetical protein